jgi:putative AlgH/UPF0301 family transcriptional regulator
MSKPTAAARSAALLRQLDASRRQRDDLRHAPHCIGGPLTTQQGYSVQIITCQTCGAQSTVRNTPKPTTRKATR